MVDRGQFREDLLYRLNLIALHLPPLRERGGDIPRLAARFLQTVAQVHRRGPLAFSPAALAWLATLPWPGNIRQLRQGIERAVLMSPTAAEVLEVADFTRAAQVASPPDRRDPGGGEQLPAVGSMTMDEIERAMIVKSLAHHAGNLSRVAESLGLSRAALYRRLEKYGIRP
jgi:two-component system, NtrC family, response regulator